MTYQHINLDYLDTISGGDDDTKQTILEMVKAEMRSAPSDMRHAYSSQNWEEFHAIAHQLKATLAFVGNQDLTEANQSILSNLEEEKYDESYDQWLSVFDRLGNSVLTELNQECS